MRIVEGPSNENTTFTWLLEEVGPTSRRVTSPNRIPRTTTNLPQQTPPVKLRYVTIWCRHDFCTDTCHSLIGPTCKASSSFQFPFSLYIRNLKKIDEMKGSTSSLTCLARYYDLRKSYSPFYSFPERKGISISSLSSFVLSSFSFIGFVCWKRPF